MNKKVELTENGINQLAEGSNILAQAVGVTLGPKGRNVIFNGMTGPVVTKDGVTVASQVQLEDPIQNLGAQLIKQAAARTAKFAGDGTTTATLLANALVQGSLKLIRSGVSPIDIKLRFEELLQTMILAIDNYSHPVTSSEIYNIAAISANNDPVIGKLIQEAFDHVGTEGVITMEDSKTDVTYIETVTGYKIERGYVSPYFVTDYVKKIAEYEDPMILVTDKKIRFTQEVVPILNECMRNKKPLVVIADEIESQALSLFVTNKLRINLPIVAVKAPAYGERRGEILKDIALATGATFVSETSGHKLEDITFEDLGTCSKVIVSKDETIIIEGAGNQEEVQRQINSLKELLKTTTDEYIKEKTLQRIGNLNSRVAVMYVGAATETELKEKKHRIDDALRATRAAITDGYVIGGGTLLAKLSSYYDSDDLICKVFKDACQSIVKKIASNAGKSGDVVLNRLLDSLDVFNMGYNAKMDRYEDLMEAGVIDPTLVVKQALTNAVSAANMLLLSDCVIYTTENLPPMEIDTDSYVD